MIKKDVKYTIQQYRFLFFSFLYFLSELVIWLVLETFFCTFDKKNVYTNMSIYISMYIHQNSVK